MRRFGPLRTVYLLPNLVTTACLFCGALSIVKTLDGKFLFAAWAILVAGLFDSLDGRLARLTKSESNFGMEYDSLCDLVSFGIAPGVLAYSWTLHSFSRWGLFAVFLYFAGAALRLARYNVQIDKVEKNSFQGIPVPVAAGVLATFVIFYSHLFGTLETENYFVLAAVPLLSVLMISTIRYPSFKAIDFRSRSPFYYLVVGVGIIALLALEPRVMFFCGFCIYVASGIVMRFLGWNQRVALGEPDAQKDLQRKERFSRLRLLGGRRRKAEPDIKVVS